MTLRFAATVLVATLVTVGTAHAQGRGLGLGKLRGTPAQSDSASSALPLQLSPSFPQFGTWLDDATTAVAGVGYASIGTSYWQGASADQIDAPIVGVTYGLTNSTQVSATVPFYRANYDGFAGSGVDNIYISGKIAVVDPDARGGRLGFAVGAAAEILGAGFADVSRAHWVVPLSAELRLAPVRLYGSTGYFSRGAFFAAAAVEWTVPTGTSLTVALAHSASVHAVTMATTASVPRASSRDASLFVSQPIASTVSLYVAGSRTFSETWINGAFSLNAGVAFRFAGPRTRAARLAGDEASRDR